MDITYNTELGILSIKPTGALEEKDFRDLSDELESLRKDDRDLRGVLIHTRDFPGYQKFSDIFAHGEFIKEHRDKVKKVALCTDSSVGNLLEVIGKSLTGAQVKKFGFDDRDAAEKWILA